MFIRLFYFNIKFTQKNEELIKNKKDVRKTFLKILLSIINYSFERIRLLFHNKRIKNVIIKNKTEIIMLIASKYIKNQLH